MMRTITQSRSYISGCSDSQPYSSSSDAVNYYARENTWSHSASNEYAGFWNLTRTTVLSFNTKNKGSSQLFCRKSLESQDIKILSPKKKKLLRPRIATNFSPFILIVNSNFFPFLFIVLFTQCKKKSLPATWL